jgi:hypothetical protein
VVANVGVGTYLRGLGNRVLDVVLEPCQTVLNLRDSVTAENSLINSP